MRCKDIRSLGKITVFWCPILLSLFYNNYFVNSFFVRPRSNLLLSYSTQLNVTYTTDQTIQNSCSVARIKCCQTITS